MTKFEQVLIIAGSFAVACGAILGFVGGGLDWFTPGQALRVMALGGSLAGGLCLASAWIGLLRMQSIAEEEGGAVPVTRCLGVGLASLGDAVVLFLVVNDVFWASRLGNQSLESPTPPRSREGGVHSRGRVEASWLDTLWRAVRRVNATTAANSGDCLPCQWCAGHGREACSSVRSNGRGPSGGTPTEIAWRS